MQDGKRYFLKIMPIFQIFQELIQKRSIPKSILFNSALSSFLNDLKLLLKKSEKIRFICYFKFIPEFKNIEENLFKNMEVYAQIFNNY